MTQTTDRYDAHRIAAAIDQVRGRAAEVSECVRIAVAGREDNMTKRKREFTINLNDYVLVKLTDRGRAILASAHTAIVEDSEGWSEWQLWVLIEAFEGEIHIGMDGPFLPDMRWVGSTATLPNATPFESWLDAVADGLPVGFVFEAAGVSVAMLRGWWEAGWGPGEIAAKVRGL